MQTYCMGCLFIKIHIKKIYYIYIFIIKQANIQKISKKQCSVNKSPTMFVSLHPN